MKLDASGSAPNLIVVKGGGGEKATGLKVGKNEGRFDE